MSLRQKRGTSSDASSCFRMGKVASSERSSPLRPPPFLAFGALAPRQCGSLKTSSTTGCLRFLGLVDL